MTTSTLSVLIRMGTGTASMVTQRQRYSRFRAVIDLDIESIETSVSHLQESLSSLSRVVIQNRRGLYLSFLQP